MTIITLVNIVAPTHSPRGLGLVPSQVSLDACCCTPRREKSQTPSEEGGLQPAGARLKLSPAWPTEAKPIVRLAPRWFLAMSAMWSSKHLSPHRARYSVRERLEEQQNSRPPPLQPLDAALIGDSQQDCGTKEDRRKPGRPLSPERHRRVLAEILCGAENDSKPWSA